MKYEANSHEKGEAQIEKGHIGNLGWGGNRTFRQRGIQGNYP